MCLCLRFGLVLVTEGDDKLDGRTDAAIGIARAFYFIHSDDGPNAAFTFLTKVHSTDFTTKVLFLAW